MGATVNQFINVSIAQLRKDNPEKLKEKTPPSNKVSSKRCGECDVPRGTQHATDCNFGGR